MPAIDSQFESTFSNLAYVYLKDKAPAVFDHLAGFQLIHVNEDETEGSGVFGAIVDGAGEQIILVPVFFSNGSIKSGVMYLPQDDLFLPLEDHWIEYVIARDGNVFGTTSDVTQAQLGISAPDLSEFSWSPSSYSKYASVVGAFYQKGQKFNVYGVEKRASRLMDALVQASEIPRQDYLKAAGRLDLRSFLSKDRQSNFDYHRLLGRAAVKYAALAESLASAYPINELIKRKPEKAPIFKQRIPDTTLPDVVVITSDSPLGDFDDKILTQKEKEGLFNGQMVIKDRRSQTNQVYNADITHELFNPSQSGVFNCIMNGGKTGQAVVFTALATIGEGIASNVSMAISLGDKSCLLTAPSHLWCVGEVEGGLKDYIDALDTKASEYRVKKGADEVVCFVTDRGTATQPFRVMSQGGADKSVWRVSPVPASDLPEVGFTDSMLADRPVFTDWSSPLGAAYLQTREGQTPSYDRNSGQSLHDFQVVVVPASDDSRQSHFQVTGTTLFVNANTRMITGLKPVSQYGSDSATDMTLVSPSALADGRIFLGNSLAQEALINPLGPSNLEDRNAMENYDPLDISHDEQDIYTISSRSTGTKTASVQHIIKDLILKANLSTKDAQAVVKTASERGKGKFIIKVASPANYVPPGPGAPVMPEIGPFGSVYGTGVPIYQGYTATSPVTGLEPWETMQNNNMNPNPIYDKLPWPNQPNQNSTSSGSDWTSDAANQISQAAASGQKDVFDVSVIAQMLSSSRASEDVDSYIPDMLVALDRFCRALFMFYSHGDTFKTRYGTDSLGNLEDRVKDTIKTLGDSIMMLQRQGMGSDSEAIAGLSSSSEELPTND